MGSVAFLHVAGEGSPSPLTAPEPSQDQLVVSANQPPLSLAPGAPFPRWWEGPALEILGTSSNVDLLIAICDFDLFQDPMASARALSRQPSARLDAILSVLRGGTVVLDNGLNRVQQILATLRNKDALSWDPAWFFHSLASSDSVEAIAERLHSTIWSAFCSVTYASWVRWILGYGIAGVSNFFAALSNFRSEVIQCRQIPSLSERLSLLEEVCPCTFPTCTVAEA